MSLDELASIRRKDARSSERAKAKRPTSARENGADTTNPGKKRRRTAAQPKQAGGKSSKSRKNDSKRSDVSKKGKGTTGKPKKAPSSSGRPAQPKQGGLGSRNVHTKAARGGPEASKKSGGKRSRSKGLHKPGVDAPVM